MSLNPSSRRSRTVSRPLPPRCRLAVERLEERTLLAGGPALPAAHDPTTIVVRFREGLGNGTGTGLLAGTTIGAEMGLVPGLRTVKLSPGVSVASALAAYRVTVLCALARDTDPAHGCDFHPLVHGLLTGVCGAFVTGDVFNLYVWFEVLLAASFALSTWRVVAASVESILTVGIPSRRSAVFGMSTAAVPAASCFGAACAVKARAAVTIPAAAIR